MNMDDIINNLEKVLEEGLKEEESVFLKLQATDKEKNESVAQFKKDSLLLRECQSETARIKDEYTSLESTLKEYSNVNSYYSKKLGVVQSANKKLKKEYEQLTKSVTSDAPCLNEPCDEIMQVLNEMLNINRISQSTESVELRKNLENDVFSTENTINKKTMEIESKEKALERLGCMGVTTETRKALSNFIRDELKASKNTYVKLMLDDHALSSKMRN